MSFGIGRDRFNDSVGRGKDQDSVGIHDFDDEMVKISDSLQIAASTLEVDFDKNLTELYRAITDQDWKRTVSICRADPIQAATWVVRHYNDGNDENFSASIKSPEQEQEIMWRFLPLHSACARQPPGDTVVALLNAYPDAAKCVDDQGMYALHYACGNQAEESVIKRLLIAYAKAAAIPDPRGMLPLHYMACWGPSPSSNSEGVLRELIQAHPLALTIRDFDGNTPLDLAIDGDYPGKKVVADVFRKYASHLSSETSPEKGHSLQEPVKLKLLSIHPTNSHGSGYNDAIVVDQNIKIPLEPPASHSEDSSSDESIVVANLKTATTANSSVTPTLHPALVVSRNNSKTSLTNKDDGIEKFYTVETAPSCSSIEISRQNESSIVEGNAVGTECDADHSAHLTSFNDLKAELNEKIIHIASLEHELKSVRMLLEESQLECSGLRQSLGDLMDKHEGIKQKSANTHDRLASLSVSLKSMKEQQSMLSKIVLERNEVCQSTAAKRKVLFDELLKMDLDVTEAEELIDASLRKQTREMDAISAVINAALD